MTSSLVVPGINIQWPWSRLLVDGQKTIETRSYALPTSKRNIPLALIETPGSRGKSEAGIERARIIGIIAFESSFRYDSEAKWRSDHHRHLVQPLDPLFGFDEHKAKWGWIVKEVVKFAHPQPAPCRRGIVFARDCTVQLADFLTASSSER